MTTAVFVALFFVFSSYSLTKQFRKFIYTHDISMQQINKCNLTIPGKVWLVSYAAGNQVNFSNQLTLMQSALNKCVDNMKAYNPTNLDAAFVEKNKTILSQARGAGYWLWKPYIILKTLNQIPEGDIVLYIDSGVKVIRKLDNYINFLGDRDILAVAIHPNRHYIKRDLLRMMKMDTPDVRDAKQLQASIIALKNNDFTKEFVKEWLELCEIEHLLTDIPSVDEHPDFLDHRHDQAIFSLLSLQYKDHVKIIEWEYMDQYFYHHRRRTMTPDVKLLSEYYYNDDNVKSWNKLIYFVLR